MKRALVIGVDDYPGTGMDLACCVADAADWADALRARGLEVSALIDKHATGDSIRRSIRMMLEASKAGDIVVICYSGHGTYVADLDGDEPDGCDEAICPHDCMTAGVITDDELDELFGARAQGVQLVFIADSCHSGTVSRFAPDAGGNVDRRGVRFMPPELLPVARLANVAQHVFRRSKPAGRRYSSLLLAACQDWEYAYEAEGNGAFTRAALDALRDMTSEATYDTWQTAIRRRLPSRNYPQSPRLYGTKARRSRRIFQ